MRSRSTERLPQTRTIAAFREEEKERRLQTNVRLHARNLYTLARSLWPVLKDDAQEALRSAVEAGLRADPMPGATRDRAAAHEAGHLIAAEALGIQTLGVEIYGSPGTPNDWGGEVTFRKSPYLGAPGIDFSLANHVRAEAVFRFAGPAAETMLTGCFLAGLRVELVETCFLAAKLADLEGLKRREALIDVLEQTATLFDVHGGKMRAIADMIARRKLISRHDKEVAALFSTTRSLPLSTLPKARSKRVGELASLIALAPVDLSALLKKVVP